MCYCYEWNCLGECLSSSTDYCQLASQSGFIPNFTFSLVRYSLSVHSFQPLMMLFFSTVFANLMNVR